MPPPLTPPPNPKPRAPMLRAPAGAVDTHIHLFGPATQYAFDPGSRYVSKDMLPATNIALQDKLGLSIAIVISGGGYGLSYRHLADVLADKQNAARFRGVALLPPQTTEAEIATLDALGVRGARFVSPGHGAHLPHLANSAALIRRVVAAGWHVQYYPHGPDLPDHRDQLLSLGTDIVLDHFAHIPAADGPNQRAFRCLLDMLDTGKVWVKLSGPMRITQEEPPYPSVTKLARALVRHAPERLVWGSDWPHVNMFNRTMPNDGDLLDRLLDWAPDEATQRKILVDNPRKLYRLNEMPA